MKFIRRWGLYLAWVIACISTLASIYSSEFLNFQPCLFCWYQRIFMFPLTILLGIAAYKKDKKIYHYVISFPIIGALIAIYQTLISSFDIPDIICGLSCSDSTVKLFNFLDMSIASLLAFLAIFVLLILYRKKT